MKEEEKDKEIEELERKIEELELKYRKLLYEPNIFTMPLIVFLIVHPITLVVIQYFLGGFDKMFRKLGIDEDIGFMLAFSSFFVGLYVLILPALIYDVILFTRLNKLYRQLAEKKGEVITGFIGDSPVFLRRWRRKRAKKF